MNFNLAALEDGTQGRSALGVPPAEGRGPAPPADPAASF